MSQVKRHDFAEKSPRCVSSSVCPFKPFCGISFIVSIFALRMSKREKLEWTYSW